MKVLLLSSALLGVRGLMATPPGVRGLRRGGHSGPRFGGSLSDDWAREVLSDPPLGLPFKLEMVDVPEWDVLEAAFEDHDAVIILFPKSSAAEWVASPADDGDVFPHSSVLAERVRRRLGIEPDDGASAARAIKGSSVFLQSEAPNARGTVCALVALDEEEPVSTFKLLKLAGEVVSACSAKEGACRAEDPDADADAAPKAGRSLCVVAPADLSSDLSARVRDAFLAAASAASAPSARWRARGGSSKIAGGLSASRLSALTLIGLPETEAGVSPSLGASVASAVGEGLCRWLTNAPPNVLNPRAFRKVLAGVARAEGLEFEEVEFAELVERGCGCFAAVAQAAGADGGGAALCRLRFRADPGSAAGSNSAAPGPASGEKPRPLALVGKGVTFDVGGVNVKGAAGMKGMKSDMAGAACAVSTLVALARLSRGADRWAAPGGGSEQDGQGLPAHLAGRDLEAWVGVTENLIGPNAMRPDDVVRACDGTTVELVHTDAEGRLVLADVLALASGKADGGGLFSRAGKNSPSAEEDSGRGAGGGPALVVDYATLTGSCIGALSRRMAGAFSNRFGRGAHEPESKGARALSAVVLAGERSGERLWPFPMDEDYEAELESDVADLLQCTVASEADHIYAATFLSKFVPEDVPWVHLDLAPAANPKGLGHVRPGSGAATGFGVRASLELILDEELWDALVDGA